MQQFIADNEVDMGQWLTLIQTTINRLVHPLFYLVVKGY